MKEIFFYNKNILEKRIFFIALTKRDLISKNLALTKLNSLKKELKKNLWVKSKYCLGIKMISNLNSKSTALFKNFIFKNYTKVKKK